MKEQYKLLLPSLTITASIVAFPTIFLLYVSLHQWVLFVQEVKFIWLGNYGSVITSRDFLQSIRVTAIFVTSSTVLSLFFGLVLALILNENLKGKGVFRALFTLPAIIPPVVAGFAWKFLLNREVGFVGGYIFPLLGYKGSILGNPRLALLSVIMVDVWSRMPLMFLILLAGLQAIQPDVYEAAEIDGANYWKALWHITLPAIRSAIIIALIIRFIDAFNLFETIFVMTSGGPGIATQTFPLFGWKIGFQYFNLGEAAALAVIMLLVTIFISQLLIRRMRQ
ncbi:MAG TPA: sugar ABC transporter permease [Spirochaetota bacterium]|nr:sugar ABC transporter permease [Spirochaetota bacterium]